MNKIIVTILLIYAASCNNIVWAKSGSNPLDNSLIYHVYFGNAYDVKRLLKKGANPNATDEHHWPALAIASDRTDEQATSIAAALIEAGADVNTAYKDNYPIINATKNNNHELVRLLLIKEANPYVRNSKGQTPHSIARDKGYSEILYYLDKLAIEQQQIAQYLKSPTHLRQILDKFMFNNCAFTYWSFYLNSGQDKNVDKKYINAIMHNHALTAIEAGRKGLQYFPNIFVNPLSRLANKARNAIYNELNSMISNRNRRVNGVGTESDMYKRCRAITNKEIAAYNLPMPSEATVAQGNQ